MYRVLKGPSWWTTDRHWVTSSSQQKGTYDIRGPLTSLVASI